MFTKHTDPVLMQLSIEQITLLHQYLWDPRTEFKDDEVDELSNIRCHIARIKVKVAEHTCNDVVSFIPKQ